MATVEPSDIQEKGCRMPDRRKTSVPENIPNLNVSIETLFTETSLKKLSHIFGDNPMTLTTFMDVLTDLLSLEPDYASYTVPTLFNAIDTFRRGFIHFRDVCHYLYEDYQRHDIWKGEMAKLKFICPAKVLLPKVHRPLPVKLIEMSELHMMFSKDGTVSFWSSAYKLRKYRNLRTREIEKERQYGKVYCDIAVVESVGKIIVSTTDKEIQFFDLQSLEPYCQIHNLPSCPYTIDAKMSSQNVLIIVFGDWHGGVNVFAMVNAGNVLRNWSERPKVMGIAGTTFDSAIMRKEITVARWKVHERRVDKVIYTELLGGQVVSCSTDQHTALSIGCAFPPFLEQVHTQSCGVLGVPKRPSSEETTYKIPFGVQTIDIWEEKRYLAASGVDKVIRVWNIMTKGDAIGSLHGHTGAVREVKFHPPLLLSTSVLRNIRIWDLKEFRILMTVNAAVSKIRGQDVFFMHFSKMSNAIIMQTTEDLFFLKLKKEGIDDESAASHSGPVVSGQYNELLNVWITCSNISVKIWDVRTGKKKSEFKVVTKVGNVSEERINEELRFQTEETMRKRQRRKDILSGTKRSSIQPRVRYYPDFNQPNDVTCVHVEKTGNRLLTGHANGIVQEFNFISGMKIRTMSKSRETKEGIFNATVNGVLYVKSALNDNILSVGWDKVVDVYAGGDSKSTEPVTSWNCYKGHEDDIWCVTSTEPNLLATGSCEGLVVIWNFTSGKIEGRLLPPNFEKKIAYDMNKVTSLSVYKKRTQRPDDGTNVMYLFSAGPGSGMHMWEIYWKIKNFYYRGRVRPWRSMTRYFCSLAPAPQRDVMLGADNLGDVYVFDMSKVEPLRGLKYNQRGYEFNEHLIHLIPTELPDIPVQVLGVTTPAMPQLQRTWPAHSGGIPVVNVCETYGLVLTGDTSGRARIWTLCGHYIGMLGQATEWDIYDRSTYQHPAVPADIQDFSREYETEQDKKFTNHDGEKDVTDVSAINSVTEHNDDHKLSNEEIMNIAGKMDVYMKPLPDFLKYENCYKIVYRNCMYQQKYSLAPVYKRTFDNELLEGLPKMDD